MNLSKSKYCNAYQCKKMLWLDKYKSDVREEVADESVLDNGTNVGIVAKDILGEHIDIEFNKDLNKMLEDTNKALKISDVVVTEASFVYENNFCSVDILRKRNNKYEIYEVKSSTDVHDIYIEDASYQYYVLTKLGLLVDKVYIVYINNKYERHGNLELNKLFNKEDVTNIAKSKLDEIDNKIKEINEYMEKYENEEPKEDIGIHCTKPYSCPFFKYCSRHLPEHNVFDIRGMMTKKKFELYHQGIYSYEDLLKSKINDKYKEQIRYEIDDSIEDIINKKELKDFINSLSYPLYFLDFETYQQPIPMYDKLKPFMRIPFQYSLHYIEKENGELKHSEFLGEPSIDPRRDLAEQLISDIPKNACVLSYNMSFEKGVIRELAYVFPDLKDKLMNIHNNICDLMIPFQQRYYYTKDMKGSYSIKYVLPALFPNDSSLNYHNLDLVHNGGEAMSSFANLDNLNEEERIKMRESLLKYCELDTYAMVCIWRKIKEVIDD